MSQIKRDAAQIEAVADALLHPGGGGIALWVRRDELMPRAAIRFRTKNPGGESMDDIQVITLAATLQIALDRTKQALADTMNLPRELFDAMCDDARKVLSPKFASEMVIRRGQVNVNTGKILDAKEFDRLLNREGHIKLSFEEAMELNLKGLEERIEHVERTRPDDVAAARAGCGTRCPSIKSRFKQRAAK